MDPPLLYLEGLVQALVAQGRLLGAAAGHHAGHHRHRGQPGPGQALAGQYGGAGQDRTGKPGHRTEQEEVRTTMLTRNSVLFATAEFLFVVQLFLSTMKSEGKAE